MPVVSYVFKFLWFFLHENNHWYLGKIPFPSQNNSWKLHPSRAKLYVCTERFFDREPIMYKNLVVHNCTLLLASFASRLVNFLRHNESLKKLQMHLWLEMRFIQCLLSCNPFNIVFIRLWENQSRYIFLTLHILWYKRVNVKGSFCLNLWKANISIFITNVMSILWSLCIFFSKIIVIFNN